MNISQSTSPRSLLPIFCHFVNLEIKQFTAFPAKGAASKIVTHSKFSDIFAPSQQCGLRPNCPSKVANCQQLASTPSHFLLFSEPLQRPSAQLEGRVGRKSAKLSICKICKGADIFGADFRSDFDAKKSHSVTGKVTRDKKATIVFAPSCGGRGQILARRTGSESFWWAAVQCYHSASFFCIFVFVVVFASHQRAVNTLDGLLPWSLHLSHVNLLLVLEPDYVVHVQPLPAPNVCQLFIGTRLRLPRYSILWYQETQTKLRKDKTKKFEYKFWTENICLSQRPKPQETSWEMFVRYLRIRWYLSNCVGDWL